MISALIVAKNEEKYWRKCVELIEPFVEEIILVDNGGNGKIRNDGKIRYFVHPETDNQGELRQFSLDKATQDWIWQVDCDEWYPKESSEKIRRAIENAKDEISFRVPYHQMSWRKGYRQANFNHTPDRIYKREVVDRYEGMLPNDMTKVKKGYYTYRPFLEYDNKDDKSFFHPRQPLIEAPFFHLARTKGYHFEFEKWSRYNRICGRKDYEELARKNQWVSGLYDMERIECPFSLPNQKEKISVIITNHNYGRYLERAIESVKNQTIKPFEIIVVDDKSDDISRDVLEGRDDVTVVLRNHNGGASATRNDGISRAKGDYFILLDADDWWKQTLLEELLNDAHRTGNEITYPDMEVFGNREGVRKGVWNMPDFTIENMKQAQVIPSVCALMDTHVFWNIGGFPIDTYYEDWAFFTVCAKRGYRFGHVKKPLLNYNAHNNCLSETADKNKEESHRYIAKIWNE